MVRLFLSPHTSGCEQLSQSRLLRTLFTLRSLERQEKPDHGFTVFIGRSLWHTDLIEEGMSLHRSVWGATPYGGVRTKEADVRVSCGLRLPYMTDELYQLMLSCWMTDMDERPTVLQIFMNSIYMSFEIYFCCYLAITLITTVLHIFMNRIYMFFETLFPFCLEITLITTVSHIPMVRIYMHFKSAFMSRLEITLTTKILRISMNRVYVCFEIAFLCCLVITLITRILQISMNRVYMFFAMYLNFYSIAACLG